MIKNEKQYKITGKKLLGIKENIAEIYSESKQPSVKDQLILAGLINMKQSLEAQIAAYDQLKTNKTTTLRERNISQLPSLIIEYKIRSGLTQKEFAKKIGMKEQQLQRYEAEDFQGISFVNLLKILQAIGLVITINGIMPDQINQNESGSNHTNT
jgi:DNA-binding XRE family transcriptional regulator